MTFVDTNVFLLAAGSPHPLRERAVAALRGESGLVTSAEVLQEILHVFLRRGRLDLCDQVFQLAYRTVIEIWSVEPEDVSLARSLADSHPELESRDLIHLACCPRRRVSGLATFDRTLAAAWTRRTRARSSR